MTAPRREPRPIERSTLFYITRAAHESVRSVSPVLGTDAVPPWELLSENDCERAARVAERHINGDSPESLHRAERSTVTMWDRAPMHVQEILRADWNSVQPHYRALATLFCNVARAAAMAAGCRVEPLA